MDERAPNRTKTCDRLQMSARNRYTYFGGQGPQRQLRQMATSFEETANQEEKRQGVLSFSRAAR